jgi:hypothetical protein
MKRFLIKIHTFLNLIGINLLKTKVYINPKNLIWFFKSLKQFNRLNTNSNLFSLSFLPILGENSMSAGSVNSHYFIQDLYVSQKIFNENPKNILDIGSRIDGFVSSVASFREIDVVDIRPLEEKIHNINFKKFDIMNNVDELNEKYDYVTSLHAIEHFGLGRYGDPIDPDGHIKGIKNFHKILKVDGVLYLSFPIGDNRIVFNGHRIFSIDYIKPILESYFKIESFSFISDTGVLHKNVKLNETNKNNFDCKFGCGIFKLKK